MNEIFLGFVNRAVTAGWLVLAVLALRLLLRRAPRRFHCLLWAAVAVRLLLPFSVESPASLIPTTQTIVPESIYATRPVIQTGIPVVNSQVNGYIQSRYFEGVSVPAGTAARAADILSVLWLAGVAFLLLYCLGTYLHMRSRLRTAVRLRDDLWQSEWVDSPFVLGLLRPRIYLPFRMDTNTLAQVEAHERAHIARGDHVWKVLAFLLLAIHWFHPLLWAAYFLFCRDLEYACDERVVATLDGEGRRRYSEALLRCAAPRRTVAPCPVAFGETGVGGRIRSVLSYKKPAFWVALIATAALIVTAVCFLTDPPVKTGVQWLRTRRAGNLTGSEIMVSYDQAGVTSYNVPLSESQRKELASLLRGLSDSQLTDGGAQAGNPYGWSLYFPKGWASLSLGTASLSRSGYVLLTFQHQQTWIQSPELEAFLRQVLPDTPLVWRCPYEDGKPQAALTIQAAFFYDDLDLTYTSGAFDVGTLPDYIPSDSGNGGSSIAGTVRLSPGYTAVWKPQDLQPGHIPRSDSFHLSWHAPNVANPRSAEVNVSALPVTEDGRITAVDYYLAVLMNTMPMQFELDGDKLILSTLYPVIDNIPFNDFYGAERYDIDGDGVEEYCTLGFGPTSGLFTFTFAAEAGGEAKYASIFNTGWYQLSFVRQGGVLKVKGVTHSGAESYFDISVRDGAVVLSENGEELPSWNAFRLKN